MEMDGVSLLDADWNSEVNVTGRERERLGKVLRCERNGASRMEKERKM